MPLLVNSVPNLAQGVSQQPDNLRYPGQCDEQVNAWATVVEGLVKRPPTNYVKNLQASSTNSDKLFTHFVKRDEQNKYVIAVSLGGISAYNLSLGTSIPVSVSALASEYLSLGSSVTNPLKDLRALTVADFTFLVNKNRTVAVNTDTDLKSKDLEHEALVFVKLGDYEKAYSVYLNGELVPYSGATNHHDPNSSSHGNTNVQDSTYISGPADTDPKGNHADTEFIAKDLETIIRTSFIGLEGVTALTFTYGSGNGFFRSGQVQRDKTGVYYTYTYHLIQKDSLGNVIGSGAKGTIFNDTSDGKVRTSTSNSQGQGYDTDTTTNPLTLQVTEHRTVVTSSSYYNYSMGGRIRQDKVTTYKTSAPRRTVFEGAPGATVITGGRTVTLPTISAITIAAVTYSIERQGAVLKISGTSDFSIRTEDGLANQGLGVAYKEVDSITDLPKRCFNGFRVRIRGDADISQDDYYVEFQTKDKEDYGEGSWVECVGWENDNTSAGDSTGIDTTLDFGTMPITIVPAFGQVSLGQDPDRIYSFRAEIPNEERSTIDPSRPYGYVSRQAGDDFTNPFPSFVGQTINDVFFFKNRLGFLTNNAVVFSEADAYFNFFRTTTQQLLDSAPIDVGLSHTKVAQLQHAIPFQEKLMLFSKQSQFVLRGADILSPKTVAISPVTEYDISDSIEPVALGNYIYFTFKRNDFEGVYEYFVDNNTETFNAEEITQQVPKYIPKDASKIVGSQAENTLVIGTDADPTTLYVYKYFWSNREKIQSAWMKFSFGRNVVGFDFIDSQLFLFTQDSEGIHLEQLTLEDGLTDEGLAYTLYLDSRVDGSALTTSYNATTKKSTISGFPYDPTGVEVYSKIGHKYNFTRTSATAGEVTGDITSVPFIAGIPYNMLYRFSNQSLKQPTERGGRSASDYTFQTIRSGSVNYADTGHFTVEVTPKYRDTYSYAFNPDIVGANLLLNEFIPQDGHFRFPVQAQPGEVTIEVKTDSALPVKLLAAEFESMFVPRSRRYGA